jgi:hypothetical protein
LIAIVAVVGVFDLLYLAKSLRTRMRPGLFERPPHFVTREERLDEARFMIGIQNSALAITLLAGYWVVLTWRKGSVGLFAIFLAFLLLPVALIAVALFIGMFRMITGLVLCLIC